MTGDATGPGAPAAGGAGVRAGIGPLGWRLLLAFVAVALSSVVVLTVAALVGTDQGLARAQQQQRQQGADRAAAAAAEAYQAAGGWTGARLDRAVDAAQAVQANQIIVRDAGGFMVYPGRGQGPRGNVPATATAAVTVAGQRVGEVRLVFATEVTDGRSVAWNWVAGAAAVALLAALAVSLFVSRRLTAALAALTSAARRFTAGDRTARAPATGPGELGELARAFNGMADQVVAGEGVRRRLAADVAHELRTPLAGLQAGLEELRDGLREPDTERLSSLHDQTLRLGRVVEDLAELSAAEAAALSLKLGTLDLSGVVAAALRAEEPRLRAAEMIVKREIEAPVPVRGDADRLHQAVVNLLANAARYCGPGDTVTVGVRRQAGRAVVWVADTGPGIAPADLPHVFERLWRGGDRRAGAGSGIGLAVVRELITAHGGSVAVESAPGQGATFTIRLPLASG